MGLDNRKVPSRVGSTTAAITAVLPQLIPEKLPLDQLWRLTMLASSANVTTKSVTAEQI